MFTKATRQQSKLRLCVSGPSGSGKTYSSLILANAIKGEGRIAVIDTENGSASLYANDFDFDVLNLEPPYEPERFVEAIKSAESEGYSVIVVDSATHEWDGPGGCLEINELTAQTKFKGNTWSAWSDTTKRHQKFIVAVVHSSCHVICTARSKTETAQEGKRILRLGTKLVQRDNFEYEFTLALDISHDGHYATAIKDRTSLFKNGTPKIITAETGESLLEWLNSGASKNDILNTHLQDIEKAADMQTLEDCYKAAYKQISQFNNEDYLNKIIAAKDLKKDQFNQKEAA